MNYKLSIVSTTAIVLLLSSLSPKFTFFFLMSLDRSIWKRWTLFDFQGIKEGDHSFQLLSFRVPRLLETFILLSFYMVTLIVNILAAMCFGPSPEATVGLYC